VIDEATDVRAFAAALARVELGQERIELGQEQLVSMFGELLRELQHRRQVDGSDELRRAVGDLFGDSRFSAGMLFDAANRDPRGAISRALSACIDMNKSDHARATSLGAFLRNHAPWAVQLDERTRNARMYQVASLDD
jgi:hypothetical protein